MNAIEEYIRDHSVDPGALMNELQGRGLITDNAAMPRDVWQGDAARAMATMKRECPDVLLRLSEKNKS